MCYNQSMPKSMEKTQHKLGKMDERFAVLEARLNRLEDPSSRTNAMNVNVY